jgi:thiamine biosynthesis lipoprotein
MTESSVKFASLEGWVRETHAEEVWGTVVTFDVRGAALDDGARASINEAVGFLHQVDEWFSTYRVDSPITALRNGLRSFEQMPEIVQQVLDNCAYIRDLTNGVFDPWSVAGGVDPSGYVKGWAADIAADLIAAAGYSNVSVNAAGDVSCRGFQSPEKPWVVGIRHPEHALEVIKTASVLNGAIATSGEYERGAHILNPRTKDHSMALTSATVVGPDGGMADALATAFVIAGAEGVNWFAGLPDWSAYLVQGETAQFFGPAFDTDLNAQQSQGEIK